MPRYPIVAILLVGAAGCLPYVAPSLVVTPSVDMSAVSDEVHVFRIDLAAQSGAPCYGVETYSLRKLPLVRGSVPPQVHAGLDSGIFIIGVALNYHFHYHKDIQVRLYRPGYKLVRIDSWVFGKQVEWIPAPDAEAREKAIDDLLTAPGSVAWCQMFREKGQHLEYGGIAARSTLF